MNNSIIYLTSQQYNRIKCFFKSKVEKIMLIRAINDNNIITPTAFVPFNSNMINNSSASHISFKVENILDQINMAKLSDENVIIIIHNHPSWRGSVKLSVDDKKAFKVMYNLMSNKIVDILNIEGIVTNRDMCFYRWNPKISDVESIVCQVDGEKLINTEDTNLRENLVKVFKKIKKK